MTEPWRGGWNGEGRDARAGHPACPPPPRDGRHNGSWRPVVAAPRREPRPQRFAATCCCSWRP